MNDQALNNAGLSYEAYNTYTQNDIGKNVTVNGKNWRQSRKITAIATRT